MRVLLQALVILSATLLCWSHSPVRLRTLRQEVRENFFYSWNHYLNVRGEQAGVDEVGPLLCAGRGPDVADFRNININDALGGYSLTLIDGLDTLAIMGNYSEFRRAVRLVGDHHSALFECNSTVQVFEATIRVLGGLLSAHLLADGTSSAIPHARVPNYDGALLRLALDLGTRLLPAFDTPTGIPYARVHLQHGVTERVTQISSNTATAGAGSLLLEFAVLSRLTHNNTFEEVARNAVLALYERRSPLGLLGTEINVLTGEWTQTMATAGAGLDSFYEYLLKAAILLNDAQLLHMFDAVSQALQQHARHTHLPIFVNIDMHQGHSVNTWVDSLSAFYPSLQVLSGDLPAARATHALFTALHRRYLLLPERYSLSSRSSLVHFAPLRPEFLESNYHLYRATRNPVYLDIAADVHARLALLRGPCGYCTVHDVRVPNITVQSPLLEDRQESFFLAETLKYLYLTFSPSHPLHRPSHNDHYLFSTQAHLFPLSPSLRSRSPSNTTFTSSPRSCPRLSPLLRFQAATDPSPLSLPLQLNIDYLAGLN